jgi:RsiW-degrading membrane proteinase PrsW (M82 family)
VAILLVAILGALIPTAFYVASLWWIDRYEKEPIWLLAVAFAWGAIPAAILSVVFELLFDIPVSVLGSDTLLSNLLTASVGAPLIEESFKGIALVFMVLFFPFAFDSVLDGIVYGAMIGFGFAFTEDIVAYFLPILHSQGLGPGLVNMLLRTVVFGLNHALWTGIVGAAVGYARLARGWAARILVPFGGWALAVAMHSLHNAGATLVQQTLCLSLGFSVLIDWAGIMVLGAVIFVELRNQSRWIERGLLEEVRQGALSQQEFDLLRSAARRSAVHLRARRRAGRSGARAVSSYFQAATCLAFKRHHLQLLGDQGGTLADIEQLRLDLAESRALAWPFLWPIPS